MMFRIPSPHPAACRHSDARCIPAPTMIRGRIQKRHVSDDPDLKYCIFVSKTLAAEAPLFIAVHGIHRGAESQARHFAPFINQFGGVLVAPLFSKKQFSDYQRLGRCGKGDRADLALKRIVIDVSRTLGLHFSQLVMFGYSGGGQFVHRYAMANPRQVKRVAITASGWFTFPDMARPFPRGIGRTAGLPDVLFDPARFLKIPTLVMVGEKDVIRDDNLNKNKKIDTQQGANRLERGQRWIAAMSASASRFRFTTPFTFKMLPGCGHSFIECMKTGNMGRMVVDFLFHDLSVEHPSQSVKKNDGAGATAPVPL